MRKPYLLRAHTFGQRHLGVTLRQGKPWQGGCDELKPCTASQQVRHLPGRGAAHQPGVSVAWHPVTIAVKYVNPVNMGTCGPKH